MKLLNRIKETKKLYNQFLQNNIGYMLEQQGQDVWYFDPSIVPAQGTILVFFLKRRYVVHLIGVSDQVCREQMLQFHEQLLMAKNQGYNHVSLLHSGQVWKFDETVIMFQEQGQKHIKEVKDL